MNASQVVVEGVVKEDGTLEVAGKVPLPAGRVQVTVQPVVEVPKDDPFWQMMQGIWDARKKAGLLPRRVEDVEAELTEMREEWEERTRTIEHLQEEARKIREKAP